MSNQNPPSDNKPPSESSEKEKSKEKPTKPKKEIPLVSVPHDNDTMDEEMAELFEEDQVTHKHGSAEPEGD